MLVLTVKIGQKIKVAGVDMTVLDRHGSNIKLGFAGPRELKVVRHKSKRKEKAA